MSEWNCGGGADNGAVLPLWEARDTGQPSALLLCWGALECKGVQPRPAHRGGTALLRGPAQQAVTLEAREGDACPAPPGRSRSRLGATVWADRPQCPAPRRAPRLPVPEARVPMLWGALSGRRLQFPGGPPPRQPPTWGLGSGQPVLRAHVEDPCELPVSLSSGGCAGPAQL